MLDVGEQQVQNSRYFGDLWRELEANNGGGYRALMAFLLDYPIDEQLLRRTLQTEERSEQQIHSLDPMHTWWLEILQSGELPGGKANTVSREDLHQSYLHHARAVGKNHREVATQMGIFLRKKVPGLRLETKRVRDPFTRSMRRKTLIIFPDLPTCRAAFEQDLGCKITWPAVDADWLDDWEDRDDSSTI